MKTLLAIMLVLLVYGVGFCGTPPRMAPTVPMAPGVVNPGAKNADNQDVPHNGEKLRVIAQGDGYTVLADITTQKDEDDGSKSIVVVVMQKAPSEKYPTAHRVAGRAWFKCADGLYKHGEGYVIDDSGDIIDTQHMATDWGPITEGTPAEGIADVVCNFHKPANGTTEI